MTALIGAIMVGPRLGKYVKDSTGKVTKVNAIPGHSIPVFVPINCKYLKNAYTLPNICSLPNKKHLIRKHHGIYIIGISS